MLAVEFGFSSRNKDPQHRGGIVTLLFSKKALVEGRCVEDGLWKGRDAEIRSHA